MLKMIKHEDNKHTIVTIYGLSVFFKPSWVFFIRIKYIYNAALIDIGFLPHSVDMKPGLVTKISYFNHSTDVIKCIWSNTVS